MDSPPRHAGGPGMQAAATATVTHGAAVPRDFRLPILGLIES